MFKTSGGKYIAPQPIENKFKESKFIEQLMVIGENEKHPSALIVPCFEYVKRWASENNISLGASNKEIIQNKELINAIQSEVDHYNTYFGNWEQLKKFELLEKEWTVESGELTPKLSCKRKVIHNNYKVLIDKIYA
jgi:long-chain acyl-CoA synthetase